MSFLPHAAPRALTYYGSFTASGLAHAGAVAFFLSGAVAFLPDPIEPDVDEAAFTVTLEILDANIVEETDVIDEAGLIPPDAVPLAPEDLTAEGQPDTLAALAPDEDTLTPDSDDLLTPDTDAALPEVEEPQEVEANVLDAIIPEEPEPETQEPEVLAPDVTEPETIEPEVTEPEVAEPEVLEPEVTEVQPEPEIVEQPVEVPVVPETAPLPVPVAPEPAAPTPLAIDGLSPIDDTVLSPLAGGGAAPAAPVNPDEDDAVILGETAPIAPQAVPDADVLALLAPEPDVQPPVTEPEDPALAPTLLPEPTEPDITAPEVTEPEVTDPEITDPEVVDAETGDAGDTDGAAQGEDADGPGTPDGEDDQTTTTQAAPAALPLNNPTASDIAIGQLLRRIRATPQPQCTLALPRRASGDPGAGISFIGADPGALDDLAAQIAEGLDFVPVQTREEIDLRQCATLDALRQSDTYPASRIGLALDSTSLSNGDMLSGRVIGAGGLFVTLLLVDDNGVVQDMAPFVRIEGTTPVFEAPVARSGPTRATRQILLALGTRDAPLDMHDRIGQLAQDVFAALPSDALRTMVFGVATFDVR